MSGAGQTTLGSTRPLKRSGVVVARSARTLFRICVLAIALCVILIAILTASARIGLPFLTAYKPSLEARLGEYLQSPVSITELEARWLGSGPILRARGVQLTDPQGRIAQFDELLIDLDVPRSLLAGGPVMNELTLVGADLAMDYDATHGLRIHGVGRSTGIATSTATASSSGQGFNAVAWLLTASRVGMLDTRLNVEMPDNSILQLDNINIRAESDVDLHQIRLDVSLPSELGKSLEIGADIRSAAGNIDMADGNFYISGASIQATGIEKLLQAYHVDVPALKLMAQQRSSAQLELWGELRAGKVQRVSGRTALTQNENEETKTSNQADSPSAHSLFGDVVWFRTDSGAWQLSATDVVLGRSNAEAVIDEIRLGTYTAEQFKPQWLTLEAADADMLPIVDTVTSLLPEAIPPASLEWLRAASVSARVADLDMGLSLESPADSLTVAARIENPAWLPVASVPGARIQSVHIDLINGQGSITVPQQRLEVLPPGNPTVSNAGTPVALPLDRFAWNAQIDLPNKTLTGTLETNHESVNLTLRHTVQLEADGAPHLDVQGEFNAASVLAVKPWLTQSWMPAGTRFWLEQALQDGKIENGKVLAFGRVDEWPYRNREGVMRAEFDLVDGVMKFLSTWPEASQLRGRVLFDRSSMSAVVNSGRMGTLPIDKATALIEDLFSPTLGLSLASQTDLKTLVNFGTNGPLRQTLEPILGGSEVDGVARLEATVSTPLKRTATENDDSQAANDDSWPVTVSGNVFLKNSRVKLAAVDLPLENVRGAVAFTSDGIRLKGVRASILGEPVRLDAASAGQGQDRRTDITMRGVLTGQKLLRYFELPIATFVDGNSSWRADASIPHDATRRAVDGVALTVTSDLVGTRVALAEPLGKSSSTELPMRLSTRFRDSVNDSAKQLWRIRLGDSDAPRTDVRIAVVNGEMDGLVVSLGQNLGDLQPESGVRVFGVADVVSIDGLATDLATLLDELPVTEGDPIPILPVSIDIKSDHMRAGRTKLGPVNLRGNSDSTYINLFVENDHLRGSMRYPREHWRTDVDARVRLNYADRVLIDALSYVDESQPVDVSRLDPRLLPPLEVHVSEFRWDNFTLKNLKVNTEPDVSGLRIRTFGFATRSTQLIGEGLWHIVDPQEVNPLLADAHTSQLHLTLQSSDLGKALIDFGYPGVVADGEGSITASLNWPDAFYAPGIETVAARASLDLKRGRLLQVEPGAARLVGLFALQTLPRRLSLDFTDIVQDGLDFATIAGDVAVENGVATTELVQLTGPVGVIDVEGTSDLVAQQFDQTVTVLPRVSSALPIIGIISGGASAGIGALIAGGVLKALGVDFDRIGLSAFSIKGDWENPQIQSLR